MQILEVIKIVNEMEHRGVIGRYAIRGAVGATFYLEPVATLDIDIFVPLKGNADLIISFFNLLLTLRARVNRLGA